MLPPLITCSIVFVPFQFVEYSSVLPFQSAKLNVSVLPGSPLSVSETWNVRPPPSETGTSGSVMSVRVAFPVNWADPVVGRLGCLQNLYLPRPQLSL